jgi:hypothetical protein
MRDALTWAALCVAVAVGTFAGAVTALHVVLR